MFLLRSRRAVVCATVLLVAAMARADNRHGQNGTDDNNEDNRAAKLGRLVVVGDSLSAGFQNFSLFDSDSPPGVPAGGQKHGFAALIAHQAGVDLNLPLISFPGIPPVFTISATGQITRRIDIIGTRENPTIQTLDLSVPGFTVKDALARVIDTTNVTNPIDLLALEVLAPKVPAGTQGPVPCGVLGFDGRMLTIGEVACAVQLKPSTVIVSIGNNDALGSLIFGVPPTKPADFQAEYHQLLQTLKSTGARVVVGNIPDVTAIPFLVPAPAFEKVCGSHGLRSEDFVVPDLISPTVTSFNICTNFTNFFVRPAALITQVQAFVKQYNGIIAAEANAAGAVVVDVNGLFSRLSQNGVNVDGRLLTTTFLGGLFSLDGIHPTNTGYAILANEYIGTINGELHAGISPVSVEQVSKTDPLLPPKKKDGSGHEHDQ